MLHASSHRGTIRLELPYMNRTPVPCPLTARELQLLASVAAGRSNRTIGRRFNISEQTVKNHLTNILHRLQVPDRTAAVVLALRHGWLSLDEMEVERRRESVRAPRVA